MNNKGQLKNYLSVFLTLAVILGLILSGPVKAVNVTLGAPSNANPTAGDTTTFDATVTIATGENIPITNVSVNINGQDCVFPVSGGSSLTGNALCTGLTLVQTLSPSYTTQNPRYGYGYGYNGATYGYANTTFGYGYGYGYAPGDNLLRYTVQFNTTGYAANNYTINFASSAQGTAFYRYETTTPITVTVAPANNAPVANNDNLVIAEDAAVTQVNVLANDVDPDSDPMNITSVTQGTKGNVTLNITGVFYKPNANQNGADSFTYTISDGSLTDTATVSVTITPANDDPVSQDVLGVLVFENSAGNIINLTATDVDNDALTYSILVQPENGTVSVSGSEASYTPNASFTGYDSFVYRVFDGMAFSNTAVVTILIEVPSTFFTELSTNLTNSGIANNLNSCANSAESCNALYFEKTGLGKILFNTSLNLTSIETRTFLQNLPSKLDMNSANISLDAQTSEEFANASAILTMYNLNFIATPSILVKLSNGTVTNGTGTVSGISYSSGTLTFNTDHFTEFVAVGKGQLAATLTRAETIYDSSPTGVIAGTWAAADKNTFLAAITTANTTYQNSLATQQQVNTAKNNLDGAINTFLLAKILYTQEVIQTTSTQNVTLNATKTKVIVSGQNNTGNLSKVSVPSSVADNVTVKVDLGAIVKINNESKAEVIVQSPLQLQRNSTTESRNYVVTIPASTKITASASWNGTLQLPTVKETSSVSLPSSSGVTKQVQEVMELGLPDVALSFDKAVRIVFPNQAGRKIGWTRTGQSFTEISSICSADTQAAGDALAADADCKIDSGADLVVWTKHFTTFATYTQEAVTTTSSSNSGGGGCPAGGCKPQAAPPSAVVLSNVVAGQQRTANFNTDITSITFTPSAPSTQSEVAIASLTDAVSPALAKAYRYFRIDSKNLQISGAEITFKVTKSWLVANELKEDKIALFRLVNEEWQELETELVSSGADVVYKAQSPGFSYFAIAETKALVEEPTTPVTTPTTIEQTTPTTTTPTGGAVTEPTEPKEPINEVEEPSSNYLWIAIVVLVLILLIGFIVYKRRQTPVMPV